MTQDQRYILSELKVIQEECQKLGISASEWVVRYADKYHRNNWNIGTQKASFVKAKSYGNMSRWAHWLERVNNI